MLRFYLRMFPEFKDIFRGTVEAWLFWIWTLLVPAIVFFNPELGDLMDEWTAISRWWALLPIGPSVAYGLLRVNYKRFQAIQSEVEDLRPKAVRQRSVDNLARIREKANRNLFNWTPINGNDLEEWIEGYNQWNGNVIAALRDEFTYATVHRFTDLVEMPMKPRGNAMTTGTEEENRKHLWYVNLLAAKLRALGKIIEDHDHGEPLTA